MARVIVTGGGRGLGRAVAERLASTGHQVVLTVRDLAGARRGGERLPGELVELDLASFDSVRAAARRLVELGPFDVLLSSAGVMQQSPTRRMTGDGVEETLQVNAVSPYLLAGLTLPAITGRLVFVTSRLHFPGSRGAEVNLDLDDLNLERGYHPDRAYKNSKLALLWITYHLARRLAATGSRVTSNAVCPGFVPTTAAASARGFTRLLLRHVLVHMPFATSVEDAVDGLLYPVLEPSLAGVTGTFFADRAVMESSAESRDEERARRFVGLAEALTGWRWPAP